jgi:hypothetical protein
MKKMQATDYQAVASRELKRQLPFLVPGIHPANVDFINTFVVSLYVRLRLWMYAYVFECVCVFICVCTYMCVFVCLLFYISNSLLCFYFSF